MYHNVGELYESGCWTQWIPLYSKYDYQINFALEVWSLLHSSAHSHIRQWSLQNRSRNYMHVISCLVFYSLPFLPMMKLTLAPRGTSSMVWHMKFIRVIFSMIPTSASDWNHNASWLISAHKPATHNLIVMQASSLMINFIDFNKCYTWLWPFSRSFA